MQTIKEVIQKEEYIALAINKYVLQTGTLPIDKETKKLNWTLLNDDEYLGSSFNKSNPFTSTDMEVIFDSKNNCYILGVLVDAKFYNSKHEYLYNFYINKLFRVNTLAPKDNTSNNLIKGSQVIYPKLQQEIISIITDPDPKKSISLDSETCNKDNYYYELKNRTLTYKYCKGDASIEVYQDSPIYLEDSKDLSYIKANIGDKAYVKKNGTWYEYYYQGDLAVSWVPSGTGSILTSQDDNIDLIDRVLSYIPNSKDLVIRRDGGCMLANGDIFCWGNNQYKKAGIETSGQLNPNLASDYVNTPIMLKVQIDNITKRKDDKKVEYTRRGKKWYNNPYRIKFEKMSMNSTNVCSVSPIYSYFDKGVSYKLGGDLFCNGQISPKIYEDMNSSDSQTSILKRNKFFATGKSDEINDSDEIYLTDIVMVEDTIAVLSDAGKIYTLGKNYKGALGIESNDSFLNKTLPVEVINSGQVFKKIFALRDIKAFGAIDSNNLFWFWGERPNGTVYNKPTLLDASKKFDPDAIFVNSKEFILKGVDKVFYKTVGNEGFEHISWLSENPISLSVFDDGVNEYYLYINEDLELKGSSALLNCRGANESSTCDTTSDEVFTLALNTLNSKTNTVNGKDYANFSNVSIFKLDHIITEKFEDFESGAIEWSDNTVTNITNDGSDQIPATSFLGRFAIPSDLSKTFSFPGFENYEVEIEFDFYEIDTWDGERFEFSANGNILVVDHFVMDGQQYLEDSNITGEDLQDNIRPETGYAADQKYRYKLRAKLDSNAKLELKFETKLEYDPPYGNRWSEYKEGVNNESWGIDNVHIKVKESDKKFVCAMTGVGSSSQMYCWGNVARSMPILSTSLYDVSKIDTINNLFINKNVNRKKQMSFNEYFNDGKLFLKYPTYIGGFDYEFYFK